MRSIAFPSRGETVVNLSPVDCQSRRTDRSIFTAVLASPVQGEVLSTAKRRGCHLGKTNFYNPSVTAYILNAVPPSLAQGGPMLCISLGPPHPPLRGPPPLEGKAIIHYSLTKLFIVMANGHHTYRHTSVTLWGAFNPLCINDRTLATLVFNSLGNFFQQRPIPIYPLTHLPDGRCI